MGMTSKVKQLPPDKKKAVKQAIIRGETKSKIARNAGIPQQSVYRYANKDLPEEIAKARVADGNVADTFIKDEIHHVLDKMRKLYDACDEYLQDPDNPEKYDLHPRAWEFDVIYREVEPDTGRMVNKKASLQALLERIDQDGYQPWTVSMKSTDPRELIVRTAAATAKSLELLGNLEGSIQPLVVQNVTVNQSFLLIKQAVIKVLKGHPDLQEKLVEELARVAP
jgi:hypothetical protein